MSATTLFTATAPAQIAKPKEVFDKYYGASKPVGDEPNGFEYQTTNWDIYAGFHDGLAWYISYTPKSSRGFTDHEIREILMMNASEYVWTRTGNTSKAIYYSAHLDAVVKYEAWYKGYLVVTTPKFLEKNP